MLKLYRAYASNGEIKIDDYINFRHGQINGQFDTGLRGFGQVKSGRIAIARANYDLQTLRGFSNYIKTLKIVDGYVNDFTILNPMTYKMIDEYSEDIPKNFDDYDKYGLNEEGALLFTNFVRLTYLNDGMVQRIFGRYPENGMYLIMPNASFSMVRKEFDRDISENYELLQSRNLGRQLSLTKMNRKIY